MSVYKVEITSTASFITYVRAESEEEAADKAKDAWLECDTSEIEFTDTQLEEICRVDEDDF